MLISIKNISSGSPIYPFQFDLNQIIPVSVPCMVLESVCLCVHVHIACISRFVCLTVITSPNNFASSRSIYYSLTTHLCCQEMHTKHVVLIGDCQIPFLLSGRDTAYIQSPMTRYIYIYIQTKREKRGYRNILPERQYIGDNMYNKTITIQ